MSNLKQDTDSRVQSDQRIDVLLDLLCEQFDKMKNDALDSKELMKLDLKSELVQQLEQQLNNPLDTHSEFSDKIARNIQMMITLKIMGELGEHQEKIEQVQLVKETGDDVYFLITLKENTEENRDEILDIAVDYLDKPIAARHKVVFSFMDKDMASQVFASKVVSFNE